MLPSPCARIRSTVAVSLASLTLFLISVGAQPVGGQIGPLAAGGVEVTPDGGTDPKRAPSGSYSTQFTVKNTGTFQYTFTLTCGRTGSVATCYNDLTEIVLAAGASGNVTVQYTTGAAGSGTVTLTASRTGASDQGSINVTVLPTGNVVPFFVRRNVDNLDRGLCLTVGAGESAGLSCGDLFVVQSMPAYRSLGKDRSVSLYYNSASATGLTLVPAWFRLPHTTATPTSIWVVFSVGALKDSVAYTPPASPICGAGCSDSFQVVAGKNLAWSSIGTGYYTDTLRFRSVFPGETKDTVITGNVLVLNRSGSEFGRGWALLGLEQLIQPTADSTQRIWVAGDGSMRVYHRGAGVTSGQLSASGLTSFSAANSVDGNLTNTAWTTSGSTATTAYARADLGASFPQAVTSARLYAATSNNATYDVQYSSNGTTWATAVAGFRPQLGWSSVVWSSVGAYRYWQLKVANNNGAASTIRELSFGAASTFYGAPGDAPDSLLRFTNGGNTWYRRWLKHGAKVEFDQNGRHQTTTNRVGAVTTFAWTTVAGQSRLATITVPPDTLAPRTYTFTWNGTTALLDSLRDPGNRGLKATITGGNLLKLRAPAALDSTRFAYDARNVLIKRIATRQKNSTKGDSAYTTYSYANNARVTQVSIQSDSAGTQFTATAITPWDEYGLTALAKVDTAGFATRIDGPLNGTNDAVDIRVERFGQARRTNHLGLGTVTIVKRDSINSLPALPTEVRNPHPTTPGAVGTIVRMSWDARGNLVQQRDSTKHLVGIGFDTARVVTYTYQSANAPDSPTRVADTLGRHTDYTYTGLGLTDEITDQRGHRTKFYYRSGALAGVVDSITDRDVKEWQQSTGTEVLGQPTTRFTYDGNGNTKGVTSPAGVLTSYAVDGLGRLTNTYGGDGSRTRVDMDTLNRIVRRVQYTTAQSHPGGIDPLAGCDGTQVSCAATPWTVDSLADTLRTRFVVSTVGIDSVIDPRGVSRSYRYDAAARLRREIDDSGRAKIATYDMAGLLTSVQIRSGALSTHLYDNYGRDTALIIPAANGGATPGDTVRTTYDLLGRRVVVRNRIATITRSYYADGSLRSQLTAYTSYGSNKKDSLAFRYDAAGARAAMYHAYAAGTTIVDSVRYAYGAASGDLVSMSVYWGGTAAPYNGTRVFQFAWDSLGRRRKVTYPGAARSLTVTYSYDRLGTLRQVVSSHPGDPTTPGRADLLDFTQTTLTADPMGRALSQRVSCAAGAVLFGAGACQGIVPHEINTTNSYSRLGMLTRQAMMELPKYDTLRYDASGNLARRSGRWFTIQSGSNRLIKDSLGGSTKALLISYTPDGGRQIDNAQLLGDFKNRSFYYDGLGRMSGDYGYRNVNGNPQWLGDEDECFWDPDGQLAFPCGQNWLFFEGHNVIRTGTGNHRWHFVHGPATDDPLVGFFRDSTTGGSPGPELFYVGDGQGREYAVADSAGEQRAGISDSSLYIHPDWQGWQMAGGTHQAQSFGASRMELADQNPLSFFRNRAYDQNSGRFTQEDPIGIAGGINLYQYAGNNPVTFTDPFGLCKQEDRGNCTQGDVGASDIPDQSVHFAGVVVNAIFGTGATVAFGNYSSSEGNGSYFRYGLGVGLDVSGGGEAGTSDAMSNFEGNAESACLGAFVVNGCATGSPGDPKVTSRNGGIAFGPSEALWTSGHAETTHTIVTTPRKPTPGTCEASIVYCPGAVGP